MTADLYISMAIGVLTLHLGFNLWVVFGALLTRGRPKLEALHILSLLYGAVMENAPWPCPLTLMQKWFEAHAGLIPFEGAFLEHYFTVLVSPHFPLELLRWGAIAVCLMNLVIYARRAPRVKARPPLRVSR